MLSRVIVLAALLLQLVASTSEAVICNACPVKDAAGCPSFSETPMLCGGIPASEDDASPCATQDSCDGRCSLCPSCPGQFLNSATVSISPGIQTQRLVLTEIAPLYEAPSFVLYRPPIH